MVQVWTAEIFQIFFQLYFWKSTEKYLNIFPLFFQKQQIFAVFQIHRRIIISFQNFQISVTNSAVDFHRTIYNFNTRFGYEQLLTKSKRTLCSRLHRKYIFYQRDDCQKAATDRVALSFFESCSCSKMLNWTLS